MSKLLEVPVHALHPTQITVGMIEVREKMRALAGMHVHEQQQYLSAHPMPAVRGADERLYITDHHHLARALWETGVERAFIVLEGELPTVTATHFWRTMVQKHWAHPINERGERRPYREIPRHVQKLRDDVYRSLAAYVREAGGFEKSPVPFAEFQWADWFRVRLTVGSTQEQFIQAVAVGRRLARSPTASELPGYVGTIVPT
jgi:hypothetical protein